ncbi:MAG: indolepyruvate ferredoxin oxidoreductase, partial [Deltaproteobacteria bacterium]|nr:indolepyruvate ferredoxin oxidoreductase [Deltaproteobacteria bacterium]
MVELLDPGENTQHLLTGNAAIARGALEAGVSVVAAYPGAPSSEIAENLSSIADKRNIYVEWSANEKVSMEVAAAASFANLRALCPMKHNGMNVASDFLLHLDGSEIRGGLVLVSCDDPGGLYGRDRGESRHVARMAEIPCLEPADLQEAKDMTRWAFELSEDLGSVVFLRSVTGISHAGGNVTYGKLPDTRNRAHFDFDGYIHGRDEGMSTPELSSTRQVLAQEKIQRSIEVFEDSPFNSYTGPEKPEVLLIACGACHLYSKEAISVLGVQERVGLLKMGTIWPLPPKFLQRYLALADKVIIVEEAAP